MSDLARFDDWLTDDGPAALVIREPLVPVEGPDGVFFPATYAAAEDKTKFAGGYNIDTFPDGTNVCLVDSVGSQANRIEPIFAKSQYAGLVPQIVVNAGHPVNLLEAGHRAGDALVRCSELRDELRAAFRAVLKGDAEPLAKAAPTSLVFGVWDSRDTQAKLPRLVASTVRAFNVKKHTRSAQFVPSTEYVEHKLLDEPGDKKTSDAYAERGFIHVPASGSHGGIQAAAVRRDATLSLAALRLLRVGDDARTMPLRRYILGLALTALTAPQSAYLRQGCNLVPDIDNPRQYKVVHADGTRTDADLTHADALAFAKAAAAAFKIGPDRTVEFVKKLAVEDIKGKAAEGAKVKGPILSVDAVAQRFTIKQGREKIEVPTAAGTVYVKGDNESTFEVVVVAGKTVGVELQNGSAVKVTGK